MSSVLAGEKPRNILLDMQHMSDLDYTAVQSLKSLAVSCVKKEIKLVMCHGQPQVLTLLRNAEIKELNVVRNFKEAMDDFSIQGSKYISQLLVFYC